jgi:putative transposase
MAWKEVNVLSQRKKFIEEWLLNSTRSLARLCRNYEISRPTGYLWIKRYEEGGVEALTDRSAAPQQQANQTPPDLLNFIIDTKLSFPDMGPRKIRDFLHLNYPDISWPSKTTIGNILTKHHLTIPRKLRKRVATRSAPFSECKNTNDLWCLDFKGWFMTKDEKKCEPFTLMDAHSRYLLSFAPLKQNTSDEVWKVLQHAFCRYGLPKYIRSDNGPPFASRGAGRLSQLSVKMIKAGVTPEWIDPGKPAQNGRHERMHLTIKQLGASAGMYTLSEQLGKFKQFIQYYNDVRPHESLDGLTPSHFYTRSSQEWCGRLKSPEYDSAYKVGRVRSCGKMFWENRSIYIGHALANEPVGIKKNKFNQEEVWYGPIFLGFVKENNLEYARVSGRGRKVYQ